MKRISIVVTIAITLGILAAAPAAAQNREHLQMAAELRILQEQQAQLALAVAQLTQSLNEAMKTLNLRIDDGNKAISEAMRKGFADQGLAIGQIGGDVRVIREGTQTTATQLGRLREEVVALTSSLPSLLTRLQPPAPVDPLDPNAPPPIAPLLPDPAAAPPASTVGLSPERLLAQARADYADGKFSLAISGFEQFIRAFPTSDDADLAQQYIGDAENQQMRFEEAITAYNRVIQNYPTGDQVPWAYYKRGLVERRLQRPDVARASLQMAIKSAGRDDHPVATLALQVLDGVAAAPPASPESKRP
jgi:TolA-binding protein